MYKNSETHPPKLNCFLLTTRYTRSSKTPHGTGFQCRMVHDLVANRTAFHFCSSITCTAEDVLQYVWLRCMQTGTTLQTWHCWGAGVPPSSPRYPGELDTSCVSLRGSRRGVKQHVMMGWNAQPKTLPNCMPLFVRTPVHPWTARLLGKENEGGLCNICAKGATATGSSCARQVPENRGKAQRAASVNVGVGGCGSGGEDGG